MHRILRRFCHSPLRNVFFMLLPLATVYFYLMYSMDAEAQDKQAALEKVAMVTVKNGRGVDSSLKDEMIAAAQRNILEGTEVEGNKHQPTKKPKEMTALLKKLTEIEAKILHQSEKVESIVQVKGQPNVIDRDLLVYEQAFRKHGFTVKTPAGYKSTGRLVETNDTVYSNTEDDVEEDEGQVQQMQSSTKTAEWEGWMVLLCMTFTDGDSSTCLGPSSYGHLTQHQKVNRIPGIRNTLWRKDSFCHTMAAARRLPSLRKSQLSLLCWVLPEQYEQFLSVADALGSEIKWVFKSPNPGGTIQILQPTKERDVSRVRLYQTKKAVVQQYFANPLLIFGMPFNVRAYVLVTSVSPLRAFIHSEGLVHYRLDQRSFKKVPNRTWYFAQLKQYLKHNHGPEAATIAFKNMESIIVQTLLVAESTLAAHFSGFKKSPVDDPYRCKNCFQLLGFDLIFNASLHPIVVEVNGQPHMQASSSDDGWASNTIKQNAIDDTVGILFSKTSVAEEVSEALEQLDSNIGVVGLNCQPSHQLCLTRQDLEYLLDSRREAASKGSFQQLYPSYDCAKYSLLLRDLRRVGSMNWNLAGRQSEVQLPAMQNMQLSSSDAVHHNTAELHPVISTVEQYYFSKETENADDLEDIGPVINDDIYLNQTERRRPKDGYIANLIDNVFDDEPVVDVKYRRPQCSEDKGTMPYLVGLYMDPDINLSPTFDAIVTNYHVTVPYDTVLIKVWAFAASCDCEARLDDKYGSSRPANYSLGIGENRVSMHVVDVTHSEPWVINTYTVHVYRKKLSEDDGIFSPEMQYQVCSLIQECDLRVFPKEPCGLNLVSGITWNQFQSAVAKLPPCHSGDAPGHWVLPCSDCERRSTCLWKLADWYPHKCRHVKMPRQNLRQCLASKKVLFIGDSTNRGMMYYLMEQVNGTLMQWDKTHNIKVYTNVNNNQTLVSFAYYPQFWLPANQRPVFDKALYQLLRKTLPLENNTNTVLIVGGVHWLATHHLNVIQQSLQREGLTGIKKVMKGLGAGFHQPVDGVHCLSLKEQSKLLLHNAGLHDYAVSLGYDVIETLNMTMARYKDFLQGKCACHFHKVREVSAGNVKPSTETPEFYVAEKPAFYHIDDGLDEEDEDGENGVPTYYHVDGNINALYSEILLSRICGG
ncbi:cadherin-like and PC-esterase domain-containing protein 1 [Ptychodera flava]|uniref:cadherin-like and PC-esterase domain-containing protein 1 n=1 Tax=Ptychodera flava TaxID=63121 RepID=UPI003969CB69